MSISSGMIKPMLYCDSTSHFSTGLPVHTPPFITRFLRRFPIPQFGKMSRND
jgi:hypothetical protein